MQIVCENHFKKHDTERKKLFDSNGIIIEILPSKIKYGKLMPT
jgi:hypothetical protein